MSSSSVWSVRMLARRAIPHTPAKRWGYGAAAAIALFALVLSQFFWAGVFAVALVVVRLVDLRRSGARRGRIPTERAYFFESDNGEPPRGLR